MKTFIAKFWELLLGFMWLFFIGWSVALCLDHNLVFKICLIGWTIVIVLLVGNWLITRKDKKA